ncbi:hypothetical protein JCM10207_006217 [Rhodosporidiobolus poonsookiae]
MLALLLPAALLAPLTAAQSCANYATALPNSTCACPPGFAGADCSAPTCDSPLLAPSSRALFNAQISSNPSAGCASQCSEGFTGPTCGVCTSDAACRAAGGGGSVSEGALAGMGGAVCSTSAWTWTQGLGSCDVVNPTLQSAFAGSTTLTFQKTVEPSQSLSSPFGDAHSLLAQLWYAAPTGSSNTTILEQFYCAADSCTQINTTSSSSGGGETVDVTCQNLRCTCIPGTQFCGAPGAQIDITDTVNGLSGTLEIVCDAATGQECQFRQSTLRTLFGAQGLALSACRWGECVLPAVIDSLAAELAADGSGSGGGKGGADELSGGVIAGLAVLGAVVVGLLTLLAVGYWSQQRARRRAGAALERDPAAPLLGKVPAAARSSESAGAGADKASTSSGGAGAALPAVGIRVHNLSYSLPPPSRLSSLFPFLSRSAPPVDALPASAAARRGSGAASVDEGRLLLSSLSASFPPGALCAILGPSGAGKSTLVDLLAGVRKRGYRGGAVELFSAPSSALPGAGERDEKREGEGEGPLGVVKVAYVDQSDVLPETSTVKEAVMFAAELKLGELPHEVKRDRVFTVLSQLGLLDVADSRIGSADAAGRRGISGGERRRVSIARELVAQPAVLILDEPTSGLDSTSALRILHALKALTVPSASSPRPTTVIATVHQPSSQLFHLFDEVLLLGQGGEQMYAGGKDGVGAWFEGRGERCPEGWNPADFMLHLASSPTAPRRSSLAPPSPDLSRGGGAFGRRRSSAVPAVLLRNENAHAAADHRPGTTALTQVQVLVKRGTRELARDKGLVLMHNIVPLIVGVIVGGMFYQVDLTIGGFQSRIGSLFFLGCLLAFAALSALSHFSHAKALFIRERARGYFHPVSWLASSVVLDVFPLRIVPTILLGVIVYFMVGLSATAAHFFKFLLILILFAICTTLWNLVLAACITDTGIAILISSIINLFQLAYAGFFLNLSRIPPVLRWLQWLAPLKYALEALAVNEVGAGLMIEDSLEGARVSISAEVIMATLFGFDMSAYYRDVLVLFGFICGFALLLIGAVLLNLREMR